MLNFLPTASAIEIRFLDAQKYTEIFAMKKGAGVAQANFYLGTIIITLATSTSPTTPPTITTWGSWILWLTIFCALVFPLFDWCLLSFLECHRHDSPDQDRDEQDQWHYR